MESVIQFTQRMIAARHGEPSVGLQPPQRSLSEEGNLRTGDRPVLSQRSESLNPRTETQLTGYLNNLMTGPNRSSQSLLQGDLAGPRYPYRPLSFDEHEIRLLRIEFGSNKNYPHLACSLEHASLIEPGPYIALSYCWGNPHDTIPLLLTDSMVPIYITRNLHLALEQMEGLLRSRSKARTAQFSSLRIWVDAICIDQKNSQERTEQVRSMRQIYFKAEEVISWIGPLADPSMGQSFMNAAAIISRWAAAPRIDSTGHNKPRVFPWDAQILNTFNTFFSHAYWKRVWIIQEITVAQNVTISYGQGEFKWNDIATIMEMLRQSATGSANNQETNFMDAVHLLDFRELYLRKREPISLIHALRLSRKTLATDLRDKIFALLGLCHDHDFFVPTPNYRQTLGSIIADMSRKMMALDRSLDLVVLNGTFPGLKTENLPTWAPNWPRIWSGLMTVQEEMLLREFKVSKEVSPVLQGSTNDILRVRGIRLGPIISLTSAMKPHECHTPNTTRRRDWIASTANLDTALPALRRVNSPLRESIWSTLVMGLPLRGLDPKVASSCFRSLWRPEGRGSIYDTKLIDWIDENAWFEVEDLTLREWSQAWDHIPAKPNPDIESSSVNIFRKTKSSKDDQKQRPSVIHSAADFDTFVGALHRVLSSGMRLAYLDSQFPRIAMVHLDAKVGDQIFLLAGCSAHVVLRELPDSQPGVEPGQARKSPLDSTPRNKFYRVIGGAYGKYLPHWTPKFDSADIINLC